MTRAAPVDAALFVVLMFLTLLVTFIGAVIAAPAAPSGAPAPPALEPLPPPPAPASLSPEPLPRRRPVATAPAARTARWPTGTDTATDAPMPVYTGVDRPRVSGGPPWGPAPKPPGPDPWAAEELSPGWQLWPDQGPVSRGGVPPASEPPPGTPAPAAEHTRYPRHARGR